MPASETHYQAYLLRLWQMDNEGQPVWRISLEEVGGAERLVFQDVAAFFGFIESLTVQIDPHERTRDSAQRRETKRPGGVFEQQLRKGGEEVMGKIRSVLSRKKNRSL